MKVSKWITSIIMVLILLPLSIQAAEKKETPKRLAGVAIIDASTVKQWLDNGDDFIILDARKTPDYEAGHLPDAELCTVPSDLNISEQAVLKSVQALENYEFLKDLEKDIKVITYCNSYTWWQSPKASLALVKMGFTNVFWMREGYNVWIQKGYPTE